MLKNYLVTGFRALAKNRTYAFINIVGLAIGLAACLLLLIYVRYETSYDQWMPGAEDVYQLQVHYTDPNSGEFRPLQMTSYVSGVAAEKDFPEVESRTYILSSTPTVLKDGQAFDIKRGVMTDNGFFDTIPLPLQQGDPETALADPRSLVLSAEEAERLFGRTDVLGETLQLVIRGENVDYRVGGVLASMPKNSSLPYNMIARFDPVSMFGDDQFVTEWGWQSGWVYLRMAPGTDPADIEARFPDWMKRNIPYRTIGTERFWPGDEQTYNLERLTDVHLSMADEATLISGNDRATITTFAIVAALILGMACVNFTNLATARASQRAREVALRKVMGATRRQLILQFMGESVLVAALSMLLALAFVELAMPGLASFLDADLSVTYFGAGSVLLPVLILVLLVGMAGGLYPAVYLSRFQPADVLRANKSSAEPRGTGRLRTLLVVGQFAVSIALIVCTATVYLQAEHARTVDPGFNRENLYQLDWVMSRKTTPLIDGIEREIRQIPGVVELGRTAIGMDTPNSMNVGGRRPGATESVNLGIYSVTDSFFDTVDMRLIAGRTFDPGRPADDVTLPIDPSDEQVKAIHDRGANVVLTELAVQRLGFTDPAEAVGKTFNASALDSEANGPMTMTIIGVMEDARFRSVHRALEPLMFLHDRTDADHLIIRYSGDPRVLADEVEAIWSRYSPEEVLNARFAEDIMADLYEAEDRRATTFAAFAVLAVIVACLGLFGLAAFTAERRTKEIGIRKVMGARTQDIVRLLAWQFTQPVIIANLIAWPAAWWVMRSWLNGFDTRIDLTPTPFILAGGLALLIALGTIIGHAMRVARTNPVNALRYE